MKGVLARIRTLGFSVQLTEEVKDFIAEKGYDVQFGARPLHRAIQKYLEDPLAEEILNMKVKEGDVLLAALDKETDKVTFTVQKETKESKRKHSPGS
jgi:ATP-dependent Clp protease ATP-binding subunit ClpC